MSLLSNAAAICASISLLTSAGAKSETLPAGGTYLVRPDPSAGSAVVELWFRAPAAGYDDATPALSRIAATAVAASETNHGSSLSELAANLGGSLTITAYPDVVSIAMSAPAANARALVRAITAAYFAPVVTSEGLRGALRDEAVAIEERAFEPHARLRDMLFAQLFSGGPAHAPVTPDAVSTLDVLSADRITAYAVRAFRRQNAILALAGNVQASDVALVAAGSPGPAMDPPFDSVTAARFQTVQETAPLGGVGIAWLGPPIADRRAATALDFAARYLFDPLSGTVTRALSHLQPASLVRGQFITLHAPGVLMVTISGSSHDQARTQVLEAVTGMSEPLSPKTFEAARKRFAYRLASDGATARGRADDAGWYAAQGDAAYAPGDPSGTYLQSLASLDPVYVAQVVREFLIHPAVAELNVDTGSR